MVSIRAGQTGDIMKIALIADIHGNHQAFEGVIRYCENQRIEDYILLGDYVGEMPKPEITMKLLYELMEKHHCTLIKGNKEDYWIRHRKEENCWGDYNTATGSLLYTYSRLKYEDIDFFETLSDTVFYELPDGKKVKISHKPPHSYTANEIIEKQNKSGILDKEFTISGHRHIQGQLEYDGKIIVNPGAVGVPLFGDEKTQFAVLSDEGGWHIEYISLDYDKESVIKELYEEKLDKHAPYWTEMSIRILNGGHVSHAVMLEKAMDICREKYGKCEWPDIPEHCYKEAISWIDAGKNVVLQ